MSQTGAIIRRNAKCFIPDAYLEAALAENPTGWGAAIVTDGQLMLNHGDTALSVDFIKDTMKTFHDNDITFYVCSSANALNTEDMSPYVILSDGDNPLLVAFTEGNFPGFAKEKSSHPPEFFLVNEYIIPKLQALYEMADSDLDKVMEFINKPLFKKELLANSVSRGAITLIANSGKSTSFVTGDTQSEYPWGWVSNNYGYAIGPGAKKEEDKAAKPSMFPKKSASTVRERAAPEALAKAVEAPKTEATVIKNFSVKKYKPAATLSRKDRKNWYKQHIGYCPPGWEKGIEIEAYANPEGKLMTMAEVKKLGLAVSGLPKLNNDTTHVEDTEADHIPDTNQPVNQPQKQVTSEILPILSPQNRDKIRAIMADAKVQKIIAENAEMIMDPAKVKDLEAKFVGFASQMGQKTIDDYLKIDYEQFYKIATESAQGSAILNWSLRNIILSLRAKAAAKEEKASVPAAPQQQERRSMFPKKVVNG